ncbi:cobalamin biosynthesis protein [Chelatococcus sp. GCM10030263]|uniref:cobalamin biosynthesis protein n=1 Tax=Chelatococcus sp. GCM10030263 TaxID=3273387 RepID=UPI00361FC80F
MSTVGDIVAGFGFRQAATAEDFDAALAATLAAAGMPVAVVGAIAVPEAKHSPAVEVFAAMRALPLMAVSRDDMQRAAPGCATHSARSEAAQGVPSVAEAAALAGAGTGADLIQARVATAVVTCALAKKR